MILGIDTASNQNQIVLITLAKTHCQSWASDQTRSRDLLVKIDQMLKVAHRSLQDLEAIAVNQGPGSYTGLRVGTAVANTLARSLQISIYGVSVDNTQNNKTDFLAQLEKLSAIKLKRSSNRLVFPKYQNEI